MRKGRGGDDGGGEDEAKRRLIFQINEDGIGTRLLEEKGQNKNLTRLTTTPLFVLDPKVIFLGHYPHLCPRS